MMNEIRNSYEEKANLIDGWKSINKNELCNLYIKHENEPIAESYFSAIVCKYWTKINTFYIRNKIYGTTYEECYDWLIESILYALKNRRWLEEDSTLYGDENGPDKAINIKMKFLSFNNSVALDRDKRKLNFNTVNLDEIKEKYETEDFLEIVDKSSTPNIIDNNIWLKDTIKEYFNKKDYFVCYLLDAIVNSDCFGDDENSFEIDEFKLNKHLNHLDESYGKIFAEEYGLDEEKVLKSLKYMIPKAGKDQTKKVNQTLKTLKRVLKYR